MRKSLAIGVATLLAFGTPLSAADTPNAADMASTTPAGTMFTAAKAWTMRASPSASVIVAPERDLSIAIVDVGPAADAKAAAAAAWEKYRPGVGRPAKLVTARAARNGWDDRQVIDYEVSPNEKLALQAIAFRKGSDWTVLILDGAEATVDKRYAALSLTSASLRPKGYSRETFAGRSANPLDASRIEALKAFVRTSMEQLGIPGAGVAVIEKGRIVYEGGIGVRELGKTTPVDAHTLFMIASNTKGMSTLLLAQLVDQGKLKWDDPVVKVFPSFRLGDAATTQQVLVRHLVCACTGLPRKDLEWLVNTRRDTAAATTFTQLAATQPTSKFGEVFQYNNLMASAAGYIGGAIVYPGREVGAAYDGAMQSMIFDPLGMKDTVFPVDVAVKRNHARPHGDALDGRPAVMAMDFNYSIMPYRPAGAAWSSAHDMIRYVGLELSQGLLPNGKRIVSAENLLARRARSVPTGEDLWYGMGLSENSMWGVPVIHHGGSMFGYKSDIVIVPGADVGAVLLTNSEAGQSMLRPFMRRLLEILYDGKPEAAGDVAAAAARRAPEMAKFRERLVVPPAPDVMATLAKAYTNAQLGRLDVRRSGTDVIFAVTTGSTKMASRKNDDGTTSLIAVGNELLGAEFVIGTQDGKPVLTTRDSQHSYVFAPIAR